MTHVGGKHYVCVDDFSRFSWVNFMGDKLEAFEAFEEPWLKLSKEHNHRLLKITKIRSDHGKESKKSMFINFCCRNGIKQGTQP